MVREGEGLEGGEEWTEEWEMMQQKERTVYDKETNRMDFANRRVTDIPSCRRTIPPQPLPPRETTILTNLKSKLGEVTKAYITSRCDSKGNIKDGNVTKDEAEGIRSIKKRVKEEEIVCMQTDKSKRLAVNTKQNYLERLYAHAEGDKAINSEDKNRIEREMNATTLQLARMLNLGEKWNASGRHWPRIKNAIRTKNCIVPPLYGLPKDHKAVPPDEVHLGPPLRPVCGATESANGALSELLTEILSAIGDRADKEGFNCLSNEELLAALTQVNQKDMKDPVVFSMDVKSMFPSLQIEEVADICATEFLHSDLEVELVKDELCLYLAIMYQGKRREHLEDLGLDQVVPKRRHPRARPVTISTDEVLNRGEGANQDSKFLPAERQPTESETRMMFSLALKELIKVCMKNHAYSVGQDDRLQTDGGPIGLKISGAVSKVFMISWCRRFKEKMITATTDLEDFDIYLYKFYVDDHNLVMDSLPPGARLVEGKIEVMTDEVEDDMAIPSDQRTAQLMQQIANTVCEFIRMEVDFPSNNPDNWMPILDNKVKVEGKKVDWCFYKKPVDSELYILNRSALSNKIKKASLTAEGLRRLRNTRPDKINERRGRLLTDMAEAMLKSGYNEEYRKDVLESCIIGYQKQVAASEAGKVPLYRGREWKEREREQKKKIKKASWFRPADSVLFVPVTPAGELANRVRQVVNEESGRLNCRIRVVERGGVTVKQQLMKTDMSRSAPCKMNDCLLCLTNPGEGGGAAHQRSGALYSGTCLICKEEHGENFESVYFGESGDSGYVRTSGPSGHGDCIEKNDGNNAFAKHLQIHHPDRVGDKRAFKFSVLRTFRSSLMRQVWEGVLIYKSKASTKLNSRSEWHQPCIDRIVVSREI